MLNKKALDRDHRKLCILMVTSFASWWNTRLLSWSRYRLLVLMITSFSCRWNQARFQSRQPGQAHLKPFLGCWYGALCVYMCVRSMCVFARVCACFMISHHITRHYPALHGSLSQSRLGCYTYWLQLVLACWGLLSMRWVQHSQRSSTLFLSLSSTILNSSTTPVDLFL